MKETRKRAAELLRAGLKHVVIRERLGISQETVSKVASMLREGKDP